MKLIFWEFRDIRVWIWKGHKAKRKLCLLRLEKGKIEIELVLLRSVAVKSAREVQSMNGKHCVKKQGKESFIIANQYYLTVSLKLNYQCEIKIKLWTEPLAEECAGSLKNAQENCGRLINNCFWFFLWLVEDKELLFNLLDSSINLGYFWLSIVRSEIAENTWKI